MTAARRLRLFAGINASGFGPDSWNADTGDRARIFDIAHYERVARIAHDGVFDGVLLEDRPELIVDPHARPAYPLDPIALLIALSQRVPDLALVATASTSFSLPYALARQLLSAQHLSGGRFGWNAVASFRQEIAENFGGSIGSHEDRYRRADEFLTVVTKLWRSWRFPWDESAGSSDNPYGAVDRLDHAGEFYRVAGPLNVPLHPSGAPLIAQAGGSIQGKRLAAKFADLVYAPKSTMAAGRRYVDEVNGYVREAGRHEGSVLILPGLEPVIASSEAEAERIRAERAEAGGSLADRIARLERMLATDLSGLNLDSVPAPEALIGPPEAGWPQGIKQSIIDLVLDDGLTLRQLALHDSALVGTPEQVAKWMEAWWRGGAAHGFIINPEVNTTDLRHFVDEVIPILQHNDVTATSYTDASIRERLGVAEHTIEERIS